MDHSLSSSIYNEEKEEDTPLLESTSNTITIDSDGEIIETPYILNITDIELLDDEQETGSTFKKGCCDSHHSPNGNSQHSSCENGCCSSPSAFPTKKSCNSVPPTQAHQSSTVHTINSANCKKECYSKKNLKTEPKPEPEPVIKIADLHTQYAKKDACKKGCCSSKNVNTEPAIDLPVESIVEPTNYPAIESLIEPLLDLNYQPKNDECKKGCCSSKKLNNQPVTGLPVESIALDLHTHSNKDLCKKGCCSSKKVTESAFEPPTESITEPLLESSLQPTKEECNKGCCSSKKINTEPIVEPLFDANSQPKKGICKKGCCSSNKINFEPVIHTTPSNFDTVVLAEKACQKGCCPSQSEETNPLSTLAAIESVKKDDCKKGCCSAKRVVIEATQPIVKEACKKSCCPPKEKSNSLFMVNTKPSASLKKAQHNKLVQKKCCDICLESTNACCKKGCCETQCCLTIELGYGGKDSFISSNTKQTVSASLLYRKCGSFFGLRFGFKKEEELIDLEAAGDRQQVTLSLEPSGLTCCSECLNNVDTKVFTLPGIISISTNLYTLKSIIEYNDGLVTVDQILDIIKSIGVNAVVVPPADIDQLIINVGNQDPSVHLLNILREIDGVTDIFTEIANSEKFISIKYDSDIIGPRDLYDIVEKYYQNETKVPVQISLAEDKTTNVAKQNSINSIAMLRRLLIISVILCIPVVILSFFIPDGNAVDNLVFPGLSIRHLISLILTTPIQFYVGLPMYKSAYKSIRYYKRANIDLLVMLSSSIAYFYSILSIILNGSMDKDFPVFFETSAILLTLIILGRFLETLARGQASNTLSKLISLQPSTATLAKDDRVVDVRLVQKGDIIRILPFSRVPLDGVLCDEYEAFLDQSAITGESVNVHKQPGDTVFSGSINQSTAFQMKATTQSSHSTIANICRLVEQCQTNKAPVAMQADKVASIFVPIIVVIACIVLAAWLIQSHDFTFSLLFSMSVLVIACPCAVALSTPTAIMVGSGVGARNGIIFKGGEVIQKCHNINTVVFDKTGTLTNGRLTVTNQKTFNDATEKQLFYYLGSAEIGSEHIIAKTLVEIAKTQFRCDLSNPMDVKIIPGRGLVCSVNNNKVIVGNKKFIQEENVALDHLVANEIQSLESEGKTVTVVVLNGLVIGVVGMMDTLRDESIKIVDKLKSMGMDIWIMSGDNNSSVKKIAKELRVTRFYGEATPASKADLIKELQTRHGRRVAMIGDGVNDAVALVQADIGIAVSNGTDVAMEAASIVLMRHDLEGIINAITLSQLVFRVIKINLCWAFFYNIIGIPLAAGAFYPLGFSIPPAFAGISELLSSLPVVIFSLLINRYKPSVYH